MNVVVVLEYRFDGTPDGKIWTPTTFAYSFWQRYLHVFENVKVVARVRRVPSVPSHWSQVNGKRVTFAEIPYYIGPWQYAWKSRQIKLAARSAVGAADAVILRVNSQIASCIEPLLHKTKHPYGVEVVADPYDVFAPGAIKHPLRPFFRWLAPRQLRRQCSQACAAAYVTKEALQRRYPCPHYSVGISDIELPESTLAGQPWRKYDDERPLNLIFVGLLEQLYKAPDVLLDAFAACIQSGLNLKLTIVGDGKHRAELAAKATALGIDKRVAWLGTLSAGDAVRAELDKADLFILPSRQEGLPRAMLEAMARGLPCIGSTVGGIPELLPPEDMVPPGDVAALAKKIREVVTNPERMVNMSTHNLKTAQNYTDQVLYESRINFYKYVRQQTENWLKSSVSV